MTGPGNIDKFLTGLEEQADGRFEIVTAVRALVLRSCPGLTEQLKYGGVHFTRDGAPFGGIYAYRAHVTLELSQGTQLSDTHGFLEGTGGSSGRKHLKLLTLDDVAGKHIADYLVAASALGDVSAARTAAAAAPAPAARATKPAAPGKVEPEQLTVADAAAWRAWLDEHEATHDGVWLTLAKKQTQQPTSLSYAEALEEALCSGWIDGRKRSIDAHTFNQHFTPRRRNSMWSQRNVGIVERLIEEGRMRDRGHSEIDLAKADGRWERAYGGSATIGVPNDLLAALRTATGAEAVFEALDRAARYSIVHNVTTASSEALRAKRIARHVARLTATTDEAGLERA